MSKSERLDPAQEPAAPRETEGELDFDLNGFDLNIDLPDAPAEADGKRASGGGARSSSEAPARTANGDLGNLFAGLDLNAGLPDPQTPRQQQTSDSPSRSVSQKAVKKTPAATPSQGSIAHEFDELTSERFLPRTQKTTKKEASNTAPPSPGPQAAQTAPAPGDADTEIGRAHV